MNHDMPTDTPVADHLLDELVQRTRLIEPGQLALRADDAWFDALADRVTAVPVPGQPARPVVPEGARRSARLRRRVPRSIAFGAIAVGAVGLGAGAAVSVTQFFQPDRLTVVCVLGADAASEQVEKRATVADPLAACRREWPTAAPAPELVVFMDRFGSVFVAPPVWGGAAGQEVTQVAQDVAFDPRPARLQAALDDWIDGLQSDCLTNDEAVSAVQDDLVRLNLLGWSVRTDDNGGREQPADGVRTCASATIYEGDESLREVVVRSFTPAGGVSGPARAAMDETELRTYYTQELREAAESGSESDLSDQEWIELNITSELAVREDLRAMREAFATGRCLTAGQAEHEATGLLDPSWNPVVDVSIDDTLPCAVVEAGMGGTWLVSIVGPETVSGG
jgi:hypothetical protein